MEYYLVSGKSIQKLSFHLFVIAFTCFCVSTLHLLLWDWQWHLDLKGVLRSCLLFGVLDFLRRLLGKKDIYIGLFADRITEQTTVAAIFGVLVFWSTTFWQRYIYVGFLTIVSQNIWCYFLGFWSLQVPLFGEYTFGKYIFCTFPDRITEHRRSYLLKIDIVIS